MTAAAHSRADVAAWYAAPMVLDAMPPAAGSAPQAAPKTPRTRDEVFAWCELVRALRLVHLDASGIRSLDYERMSDRVQSSPTVPDEAILAAARTLSRGPDPIAERLAGIAPGRPKEVLAWLRTAPAGTEFNDFHTHHRSKENGDDPAMEASVALTDFLDALATKSGIATDDERRRWAASGTGGLKRAGSTATDAQRMWARLRLREAWSTWFGAAW